jgi:response regulator NasT
MTVRIVIAEDEAIIRLDLRETLVEEGYEVVGEAANGDEAIALIRQLQPDLAILDIKMPVCDGVEATKIISAEKLCPVILVTAFSQREIIESARDFKEQILFPRSKWLSADSERCNCSMLKLAHWKSS